MDWLKKKLGLNLINIESLSIKNSNKTYNIQVFNFPSNKSYKELRKEFPELPTRLKNHFSENHKESNEKLILSYEPEEGGEGFLAFNPIHQIEKILNETKLISIVKRASLEAELKNFLLDSIYHFHQLKKKEDYDKFRSSMSSLKIRVFNLYCTGWVDTLIAHLTTLYGDAAHIHFALEFKDLVENKSIIFVNKFTTYTSLKREFLKQLQDTKYCILHCIGKDLIKFVKDSIKKINDELKPYDYSFTVEEKFQLKNKGKQYTVQIDFDEDVIDPYKKK